jgi:hypothetical protein
MRFCGEGDAVPCSVAGVQPGSVYDLATGSRVPLPIPKLAYPSNIDSTAFSGAAVIAAMRGGSTAGGTFAWDVATGRRVELARAPATMVVAVWTGRELVAIAVPNGNGRMIGLRLAP